MLQWEGTIKGRAQPSLRAVITVIWVFQHKHLGLLTNQLSWCPLSRKHNQNAQCYLFVNMHASRPIWRTFELL